MKLAVSASIVLILAAVAAVIVPDPSPTTVPCCGPIPTCTPGTPNCPK